MRLPTEAQPDSRIKIDGQMSDLHVARTEEDGSRIAHQMFGHISHRKMAATSAVVDSFPKYSKHATWCTSCHKGKMHMLPHSHNLWNERAEHAHDAWHIDLVKRKPDRFKHEWLLVAFCSHRGMWVKPTQM